MQPGGILASRKIADEQIQGLGFEFRGSERPNPRNRLRHPLNA
jgi:hypothetical protein